MNLLLKFYGLLFVSAIGATITAFGQVNPILSNLELTYNKTSCIVFPAEITTVDLGSGDILAQKAKGVSNVLKLKAGKVKFPETNLTVITADGSFHHFTVSYADLTDTSPIHASANSSTQQLMFESDLTSSALEKTSRRIVSSTAQGKVERISRNDLKMTLKNISIANNTTFYYLRVENESNIPFHLDMIRFYIKDKTKPKRTAAQEVTQSPIYQYGTIEVIEGKSIQNVVYALPKFIIPEAKILVIELIEKKGGRNVRLKVNNKSINKAKPVNKG